MMLGIGATLIGCGLAAAAASRPAWRTAVWAQIAPMVGVETRVPQIQSAGQAAAPAEPAGTTLHVLASDTPAPQPVGFIGSAAPAPVGDAMPEPLVNAPVAVLDSSVPLSADERYRSYVTGLAQRYMRGDRDAGAAMLDAFAHPGEVPEQTICLGGLRFVTLDGAAMKVEGQLSGEFVLMAEQERATAEQDLRALVELKIATEAATSAAGDDTLVFTAEAAQPKPGGAFVFKFLPKPQLAPPPAR
jgi:hypothetical protein